MGTGSAVVLSLIIDLEPNLAIHIDSVHRCSCIDEREIERITVVGRHDGRFDFAPMLEEASDQCCLVFFVEDDERSFVVWFRSVFKVLYVFRNDFAVGDEVALSSRNRKPSADEAEALAATDLSINHVGYHHDLILLLIGKFERCFRRLNVESQNDRIITL